MAVQDDLLHDQKERQCSWQNHYKINGYIINNVRTSPYEAVPISAVFFFENGSECGSNVCLYFFAFRATRTNIVLKLDPVMEFSCFIGVAWDTKCTLHDNIYLRIHIFIIG